MNPVAALLVVLVTARSSLGGITIAIPEGWRRLDSVEMKVLKVELDPQNRLQRRLKGQADGPPPLIVMKHDVPGTIAASIQVFLNPIPAEMRYASSIELTRVIAFATMATFRGEYEVQPHETTVGDLPAAEWVAHYTLVETGGSHAMRTRNIIVARGDTFYLVGYTGPANDTADFDSFDAVVKSIQFVRK
ncbi:MAG TPA: hypothetical protein VGQ46_20445 [Thermoanaerobaculia bacterium]|jgi:hypothetical protein|nr:hypothetical protein [Thermoanaerobaculia bacterium]